MCFWKKKKNWSNPQFLISKKYRQKFFRLENFNYKRPLFFELHAVELAILFMDSEIGHANQKQMKIALVPIYNTSFSKKVPVFKSCHKNVTLPKSLKLLCPLTVKWWSFQFFQKFVKNLFFIGWYFSTWQASGTCIYWCAY